MEHSTDIHIEDRELVEKLAKLQDMHQQIIDLRGLLPERLLRPTRMALENPRGVSPEKLASNIKKAASDGSRDIQRFKRDFQSQEMKDLWQKTSNAEFPQGRDSWTVDYQSMVRRSGSENKNVKPETGNEPATTEKIVEDEEAVFQQFQENSSSALQMNRASQTNLYPLGIAIDGLSFNITQQEKEGAKVLIVEASPDSNALDLTREIVGLTAERKSSSSLQELLSMLTTYHDFKFKACEKCRNIFDDNMNYALARRRKPSTEQKDEGVQWEVLHQRCV